MWNIASFIFGIGAWLFAFWAIITPKAPTFHKTTAASFSLCAVSLVFQLCEINRRVLGGDYAGIEDTIGGILIAAIGLVAVTVILNLAALLITRKK